LTPFAVTAAAAATAAALSFWPSFCPFASSAPESFAAAATSARDHLHRLEQGHRALGLRWLWLRRPLLLTVTRDWR